MNMDYRNCGRVLKSQLFASKSQEKVSSHSRQHIATSFPPSYDT